MSDLSPLSGAERKLHFGAVRSVEDPNRTFHTGIACLRRYWTFSQTRVTTLVLPSPENGAAGDEYTNLSPSLFSSLINHRSASPNLSKRYRCDAELFCQLAGVQRGQRS
jgi:hypothetical protein